MSMKFFANHNSMVGVVGRESFCGIAINKNKNAHIYVSCSWLLKREANYKAIHNVYYKEKNSFIQSCSYKFQ